MNILDSRAAAFAVIVAGLLVYPVAVVASGAPKFPSVQDCVMPATHDGKIQLVLGSFASAEDATALAARAEADGFVGTHVTIDDCGQVVVAVPGYSDLAGALSAVKEARRAGFSAKPEFAP